MDITLHPGQEQVLDSKARFIAVSSGVQGGKTTVGAIWLCNQIWQAYEAGKTGDWLIAAPTNSIIQQSTLVKFRDVFPRDWGEWKEGRREFHLAFGGRIFVRSTDIPEHLEGMTIMGAWLDEAGQMADEVWINIQARVAVNKGKVLMTSTPYSMNWYYRDIYRQAGRDPDIELITWPSNANPKFPPEDFERAQRTMVKALFERRYLGKFTRLEGLVYPDFDPDVHLVDSFEIPANWERFGGMDFGHSVPSSVICIAKDPVENKFYVYREYYKKEALLREIANFLSNESLRYIMADSQGAQNIAELSRFYGCRGIHQADKGRDSGFARISSLLKEHRLFFLRRRCDNTISEITDYHWKPNNPNKADSKDEPVKKNDHCMDALRYAFSRVVPGVYPGAITERRTLKDKVRARLNQLDRDTDRITGY